jgi:hypothetical protein
VPHGPLSTEIVVAAPVDSGIVDVIRCSRSSPRALNTIEISWLPVNVRVARKKDKLKIKNYRYDIKN